MIEITRDGWYIYIYIYINTVKIKYYYIIQYLTLHK